MKFSRRLLAAAALAAVSLPASGCLWLAIPSLAYEGYKYEKSEKTDPKTDTAKTEAKKPSTQETSTGKKRKPTRQASARKKRKPAVSESSIPDSEIQ